MERRFFKLTLAFLISASLLQCVTPEIINKNVDRVLDLSTQLTKETLKITATDDAGKQFSKYQLVIPEEFLPSLSYISVKDARKKELKIQKEVKNDVTFYNVDFPKAANTQEMFVELVYIKQIQPYPVEIKQSDKQLVKFNGYLYLYTPYKTAEQKTQVVLSSSNVITYNQTKPYTLSGSKIKYGPYENIEGMFR